MSATSSFRKKRSPPLRSIVGLVVRTDLAYRLRRTVARANPVKGLGGEGKDLT